MNIEEETKTILEFVDKGNFHAAMNIAISALNDRRRNDDQKGTDHFLEVIRSIAETMRQTFGSR